MQSRLSNHLYIEIAMVVVMIFETVRYFKLRKEYETRPSGFVPAIESKSSYDVKPEEEI